MRGVGGVTSAVIWVQLTCKLQCMQMIFNILFCVPLSVASSTTPLWCVASRASGCSSRHYPRPSPLGVRVAAPV